MRSVSNKPIMLGVIMLTVIVPNVAMLSVFAPKNYAYVETERV
jgi:hypothetical protein